MENITYLWGAGASCGCLPVVAQMKDKINETTKWLSHFVQNVEQGHYGPERSILGLTLDSFKSIIEDLSWLAEQCDLKKNFSIDTYAKKLEVAGKFKEARKLKNALTLYFTLQQKKDLPDVRYDNFWASIMKRRNEFPNNVRILSWNYDFQPELTYQDFINCTELSDCASNLKVLSHASNELDFNTPQEFKLFKLNGSATYVSEASRNRINYLVDEFKSKDLSDFFYEIYHWYSTANNPLTTVQNHLSYAWEHDKNSSFYNFLKQSVKNTNILVVIGYSFPYFNREVDKLLLGDSFMPNLRKAYFQASEKDIANLIDRFSSMRENVETAIVKGLDQFAFPNEL